MTCANLKLIVSLDSIMTRDRQICNRFACCLSDYSQLIQTSNDFSNSVYQGNSSVMMLRQVFSISLQQLNISVDTCIIIRPILLFDVVGSICFPYDNVSIMQLNSLN